MSFATFRIDVSQQGTRAEVTKPANTHINLSCSLQEQFIPWNDCIISSCLTESRNRSPLSDIHSVTAAPAAAHSFCLFEMWRTRTLPKMYSQKQRHCLLHIRDVLVLPASSFSPWLRCVNRVTTNLFLTKGSWEINKQITWFRHWGNLKEKINSFLKTVAASDVIMLQ